MDELIELIEVQGAEERGQHATRSRPTHCHVMPLVFQVAGFQQLTDELEEAGIVDLLTQDTHEHGMVDGVEVVGDAPFDEPSGPRPGGLDVGEGSVAPASRTEAMAPVAELGLVLGCEVRVGSRSLIFHEKAAFRQRIAVTLE